MNRLWIIGGVTCYMLVMLGVGFWASRRVRDLKDYVVAGNRMGWLLSIGTIFATWFGAETCMGASGTAFQKGILGVIADPFGAGLCLVLAGLFFAGYFRRLSVATIIDFFQMRYGRVAASCLSIVYIPVYIGWIGAQLLAFGYILHSLGGLPLLPAIWVSTAVVAVYTYSGGMWAVAVTDLFQALIVVASLLILYPILVHDIGGFASAKARIPSDFFRIWPADSSLLSWLNYVQAWIIVGLGSLPAQDLFQRIMAARNATISRWAAVIAGLLYVAVGLLPVFLGMLGRVAVPESSGERILIELALKYLSPPLIALMIGALLSAIMSSADSALLAPATIIGRNVVPLVKPDASEALQLKWCRWSVPILCTASLLLALYFQNIYRLCQEAWGILLTGVFAPMTAGAYWKKANTAGAIAGALTGVAAWLMFKLFLPENYPHNLFGLCVGAIVLVGVSLLTQHRPAWRNDGVSRAEQPRYAG